MAIPERLVVTDELIEELIKSLNRKGTLELFGTCVVYHKKEGHYRYLLLCFETQYLFPEAFLNIPVRPRPYKKLEKGLDLLRSTLRTRLLHQLHLSLGGMTLKDDQVVYDEETDTRIHTYTFSAPFIAWEGRPESIPGICNIKWVTCAEVIESAQFDPWVVSMVRAVEAELLREDEAKKQLKHARS